MKHGTSPRTGSSGGEPGATDWSIRGNGENTTKRRPGLEHPGRSGARPEPPDWIVRGRTRCHGLERPRQRREYDKNTPRIAASEAERSTALAPGLDRPGVNPVPRTGDASEASSLSRSTVARSQQKNNTKLRKRRTASKNKAKNRLFRPQKPPQKFYAAVWRGRKI